MDDRLVSEPVMVSFKNVLSIKLQATGLVAALIVWVGAVAVVGIFAEGRLGAAALGMLSGGIGGIALLAGRAK
jgi:hypothetical protein